MTDTQLLMGLANLRAEKRVKDQLREKGFKPQAIEPLIIQRTTRAYLEAHLEELVAEAKLRLR
jgi:hypothetical protein